MGFMARTATREFAVIGLGRFGASVALTLHELGYHVLGVDVDEAKVQALANRLTHVIQADCTDENTVRSLGLRNFDTVVVAIGQDLEASVLVTLMLKELGVKNVVAKAATDAHGKVLERIGADRVVFPEKEMGAKVARFISESNILDYIELTPEVSVVEFTPGDAFVGKTLREIDFRAKFGVTVLAIRRGDSVRISPPADQPIRHGDILVAIGENSDIERLETRRERDRR